MWLYHGGTTNNSGILSRGASHLFAIKKLPENLSSKPMQSIFAEISLWKGVV
jgi:hypothetical protein